MKNNMLGIIFTEIYGSEELNALTYDRSMAAIPFGGRYRLVDFTLSNMVNSGVDNIGVLVRQYYRSLMDHLSNGQEWDLNRKKGGLHVIPPYANESSAHTSVGKLDELRGALDLLIDSTESYVLLTDANVICSMDYRPALEAHIASGADITAVTYTADGTAATPYNYVFVPKDGKATAFALNEVPKAGYEIGIGTYIISREMLIDIVTEFTALGAYHFERAFMQRQLNAGKLSINLYSIDCPVLFTTSVTKYLSNSLALTDQAVSRSIFRPDWPIYTRVNDEVPTYYGAGCDISSCVIADGCVIEGTAEHSVLSRGVRVGKGAKIANSVIMQGVIVGENAVLENVIIDKWAVISPNTELKGLTTAPVIIRKGANV